MNIASVNSWPSRAKLTTIITCGIIAMGIIIFAIIKPLAASVAGAHQEAQKQRNELNRLLAEEASYKSARDDFNRISSRAQEIASLFPTRENLVGHVKKLEAAASEFENTFSLSITDASEQQRSTTEATENKPYTIVPRLVNIEVIPYDFQIEGSYASIVRFLQTLENQPFFSEIDTLSFNSRMHDVSGAGGISRVRTGTIDALIRSAFYAKKN